VESRTLQAQQCVPDRSTLSGSLKGGEMLRHPAENVNAYLLRVRLSPRLSVTAQVQFVSQG
jgi:hypothetical protein